MQTRSAAARDKDLERRRTLYRLTGRTITRADDARPVDDSLPDLADELAYEAAIRRIVRDPTDFLAGAPARSAQRFLDTMAEAEAEYAARPTAEDAIRAEMDRLMKLPKRTDDTTH